MSDPIHPFEMSDEDILNMSEPPAPGSIPGSSEEAPTAPATPEAGASEAVAAPEDGAATPTGAADGEAGDAGDTDPNSTEPAVSEPGTEAVPAADGATEPVAEPKPGGEVAKPAVTAEQALEVYNKIMAPFKANGKMIELRNVDEAIGLMQMGANYTRKMQELQPHRKTLLMLQNNDLLDPDKLSFLIDLDKGDPEALKKFIKDRGIDPLDIDTSTDPAYLGGNHQVSDEEASFRAVLEDLRSTPEGVKTLTEVNSRWDTASKDLLWKNPELLEVIQEQRESGVYDVIAAEIDRQKTLGKLRADMPFIEAYKTVGDQLVAENNPQGLQGNVAPEPAPTVLATRPAAPKPSVQNADQVAAAAPSRGTAVKPKATVNFLEMSDDEFLKQMANRV